MDEQSLLVRQGGHTTNRILQQMNSNRSSNQGQGKAKGKNRPKKTGQAKPRPSKPAKKGQVAAAAAYATGLSSGRPQVHRDTVDSCRIVHRELIASVTGSVAFTVTQFNLNPGLARSFPWLANEALGWERYRFNRLNYCYYTRTGSNIPGSVLLAPDYDAADPAPVTEQGASSYADAAEDAPWKDITCRLGPQRLNGPTGEHYVRSGALPVGTDIKLYDSGILNLCCVDGTPVPWGKLWVEYDVTFFTPQVPPGGFQGALSAQATAVVGQTAAAPFGTSGALMLGTLDGSAVGATLTLNQLVIGSEIEISTAVTGTVISAAAHGSLVGLTLKNTLFSGFPAAATSAAVISTYIVTASLASVNVALTATTVTQCISTVTLLSPVPVF